MTQPTGLGRDAAPRRTPARRAGVRLAGAVLTAPALAMIAVFFYVPLVTMLWMTLHDWPLLGERRFIGLRNYRDALGDAAFRKAVLFTFEYTLISTPVLLVMALGLALLVRRRGHAARFFQGVYFMPVVIGYASGSFLWLFLFQSDIGPVSDLADRLGLASRNTDWFASKTSALLVVIANLIWKIVGLQMLLLLAGLQAIPAEVQEAARVDGANQWQTLRHITLPLLRPTLALVLVFTVANSLLVFDQFFIMTSGGPTNSTITAVYEIYRTSFTQFKLGLGATFSALLMIVLMVVSALQLYLLRSSEAGSEP
jgi:multiple sugar transport system permease protein